MALINELTRASQFLYSQLGTLPGGAAIYDGVAPLNSPYPYVIVQVQSPGADMMGVGTARIWATPLFLVKAIDKTRSWSTLTALADAIETRLHGATGSTGLTATDGRILSCVRESPFSLIEESNGDMFRSLGGLFRLIIQGNSY